MRNVYYYSFYLLASFSKKVNKSNSEYAFSGMAYLSLLMSFNLFTLFSPLRVYQIIKLKGSLLYIAFALGIMAINYYFLMANNKSEAIFKYYKERETSKKNKNKKPIIAFCIYVVASLLLCGYTAYLVKNAKN